MALRTLPQDVLADILDIGLFSRPELCAISLASPHLRYEAQRRLFRDPGPHSIDLRDEPSASLATTRTFLETITASPDRLAQMVRRYRVTVLWFDFYVRFDSEKIQLQHTLFELLSRALPLMVNLIELLYRERLQTSGHPVSEPPPSMWPVLQMCSFKLQIFWCSYIGTNSRNAVAEFLHIQNGIRVLWLCEAPQAHATNMITLLRQVYSDMCPALVSLGGTLDVVASMLSGRQSLQHMSWDDTTYGPPVKYDGELFRSTNTSTVETLESLKNGPPLNLICGNFENLVALKTCEFDLMQKLDILKKLQRLRLLMVYSGGLVISYDFDNEEGVVRKVFWHLSSLDSLECYGYYGNDRCRKYVLDQNTHLVTIYETPTVAHLSNPEGRDELLRRLSAHADKDYILVRSFSWIN